MLPIPVASARVRVHGSCDSISGGEAMLPGKQQMIRDVASVMGTTRAASENCWEICQDNALLGVASRGGTKPYTPTELNNFMLTHCLETRRAAGKLIPELRALRAAPPPSVGWVTEPHLGQMVVMRGCCFTDSASIELDAFRDALDDLPKWRVNGGWSGDGDPRCYRIIPGETLGEAVDLLVDYLSYPVSEPLRSALLGNNSWKLRVAAGPYARISFTGIVFTDAGRYDLVRFFTHYHKDEREPEEPPGLVRMADVSFKVFALLADFWAESRAHLGIDSFPSFPRAALAGAAPGDESVASSPLPGAASTHSTDRQSDEGANAPPRKARGPNSPEGNACVSACAITSSRGGRPMPPPTTKEARYGHAHHLPPF